MTEKQKADIIELRSKGLKYSDIADRLQLSINTVKSFYRRCKDTVSSAHCKCCGRLLASLCVQGKRSFALMNVE